MSRRAISLTNPAPGHEPTIGRTFLGKTMGGGNSYGTTLRCSCGWRPGKVSNEAPSQGGSRAALHRYLEHLGPVPARDA